MPQSDSIRSLVRPPAWLALLVGAALFAGPTAAQNPPYEIIASFPYDRPTAAVAVPSGRIFVSLPFANFSDERHQATIVEVLADGRTRPYPSAAWNSKDSAIAPIDRLLNVQSLTVDREGFLWALDTGSPKRAGVVPGGAKLVKIDTKTDRTVAVVPLDAAIVKADSYLNDVRVDAARQYAYITDSVNGGIVVVDIRAGTARMTLVAPHPQAILAEARAVPVIEGVRLATPQGGVQSLATDGLALTPDADTLFVMYRPLSGSRRIYRIATRHLRDPHLSPEMLATRLDDAGPAVVSDGIEYGPDAAIYYSDLQRNAISRAVPGIEPVPVLQSPTLRWPDGVAFAPNGDMLVTVAQFHLLASANEGTDRSAPPYLVLRVRELTKTPLP